MLIETETDFHMRRARDELDSAYRAPSSAVAAAHLRLSVLHMQKLRGRGAAGVSAAPELRVPVESRRFV